MGSLTYIAEKLLADAKQIDEWASSKGFDITNDDYHLQSLPMHLQEARDRLINGTTELKGLVESPESAAWFLIANVSDAIVAPRRRRLTYCSGPILSPFARFTDINSQRLFH
jgi:hypothetical protein